LTFPRFFINLFSANPKDAKGKAEEEEVKEEPPLDTLLKKECDLVYFVIDYPSSKVRAIENMRN